MRYRRVLPAGRRPQADRRHDRADRAPRPRLGRDLEPRGRADLHPPRPPAAVDHRPVHLGQPALHQGRPHAGLQRRAVQLPGAAGRAGEARACPSSPAPTPRSCWRHGGTGGPRPWSGSAACSRSPSPTRATGELALARDPLGIKPLLYLRRGDGIVFASELKALLAAVGPELKIEPGAMVASMLYYWVPEQRCSIQGVRKLPGGQLGAVPPGRHARGAAVLARAGRRPGRGGRAGRRPQGRHRGIASPRT